MSKSKLRKTVTVQTMLQEELERRGFDGLYHPDEPCGCFIGDLAPCGYLNMKCKGGYRGTDSDGNAIIRPLRRSDKPPLRTPEQQGYDLDQL